MTASNIKAKDTFKLQDSISFWVSRLHSYLHAEFSKRLAPHDISRPEWAVLITCYQGASTPAEISRYLDMDGSLLTRMLDRLEEKGQLVRKPHPSDRRSTLIRLTPAGRKLIPRLTDQARQINMKFLAPLNSREVSQFRNLLEKMVSRLDGNNDSTR